MLELGWLSYYPTLVEKHFTSKMNMGNNLWSVTSSSELVLLTNLLSHQHLTTLVGTENKHNDVFVCHPSVKQVPYHMITDYMQLIYHCRSKTNGFEHPIIR